MPSYKDFYGSSYLAAKDLGKRIIKGKILTVGPETIKGKDSEETTRLVISISGEDKQVALNASNANRLGTAFGEDFTKWKGKSVQVNVATVQFAGKDVDGLYVKPVGK